ESHNSSTRSLAGSLLGTVLSHNPSLRAPSFLRPHELAPLCDDQLHRGEDALVPQLPDFEQIACTLSPNEVPPSYSEREEQIQQPESSSVHWTDFVDCDNASNASH
ncbi:hypothetical protein Ciccas_008143, partial [Cichlidogyrus casuarinus]